MHLHCTGFNSLTTDVDSITEDFEKYPLDSLIAKLNNSFPLHLAIDIVCDRFTEDEVFC